MAQAKPVIRAIRELMSRDDPAKSTSAGRPANIELVAALAANPPHRIPVAVESDDLDCRADHLEKVLAAMGIYLDTILVDTAENIPGGGFDRKYLNDLYL